MTYGVLYIEEGNFLNWYERREDAERAVLAVVEQQPAQASEFGYFAFSEDGQVVGAFISGAELLRHQPA